MRIEEESATVIPSSEAQATQQATSIDEDIYDVVNDTSFTGTTATSTGRIDEYDEVGCKIVRDQENLNDTRDNETADNENNQNEGNIAEMCAIARIFDDEVYGTGSIVTKGALVVEENPNSKVTEGVCYQVNSVCIKGEKAVSNVSMTVTSVEEREYDDPIMVNRQRVELSRHSNYNGVEGQEFTETKELNPFHRGENKKPNTLTFTKRNNISQQSSNQSSLEASDNDPVMYNCQFDDPVYDSTPKTLHNTYDITSSFKSTTSDAHIERDPESGGETANLQGFDERISTTDITKFCDRGAIKYTDAPDYSEPKISLQAMPIDVHSENGNRETNDTDDNKYNIFDDPIYGISCATSKTQ